MNDITCSTNLSIISSLINKDNDFLALTPINFHKKKKLFKQDLEIKVIKFNKIITGSGIFEKYYSNNRS